MPTTESEYTIRPAVLADLPQIVAIYNSTIASRIVTADLAPVTVASRWAWFAEHTPERRPLWVALHQTDIAAGQEHNIAGWLAFSSFYDRAAYDATVEVSLYIHENGRGKGLGKLLHAHGVVAAQGLGIRHLVGYISALNAPSLAFFAGEGYALWGTLPNGVQMSEAESDVMIMGRRL